MSVTPTEIRGTVAIVNDRGVKLEGESEWRNFSRFAVAGAVPALEPDDLVELVLDGKGFIRSGVIIGDRPSAVSDRLSAESPLPTTDSRQPTAVPSKDTQIIRESCLKTAAAFCAARPELKSADLFCLAERLEAWVLR